MLSICLPLLLLAQVPDPDLQQALRDEQSSVRFSAALTLASGGPEAEAWLVSQFDRGDPGRRRALMVAAAWMGTAGSLQLVERAAAKGRRPDRERAFALLLYGAYHPQAGQEPEQDWSRCASPFEQACLLAGLMGRQQPWDPGAFRPLLGRRPQAALSAILDAAEALHGATLPENSGSNLSPVQQAALALASLGAKGPALTAEQLGPLEEWKGRRSWWLAAKRTPGRSLKEVEQVVPVGEDRAALMALYELDSAEVAVAFPVLAQRVVGAEALALLWGAVGDRGLPLPGPQDKTAKWGPQVAAGLLRTALVDPALARQEASAWSEAARQAFSARGSFEERWPAALVLALAGGEKDRAALRGVLEGASGEERWRLMPAWSLALSSAKQQAFSPGQRQLIQAWSRELGAGRAAFLATEGPRFLAYLLLGATQAAGFRLELSPSLEGFDLLPLDAAADDELYRDLAEFLLGKTYAWPESNA